MRAGRTAQVPRYRGGEDRHRIITHIVIHTHTMGCLGLVLLAVQRIGKREEQGRVYRVQSAVLGFALRDLGVSYWVDPEQFDMGGKTD